MLNGNTHTLPPLVVASRYVIMSLSLIRQSEDSPVKMHLPLISISRSDFDLRGDTKLLLSKIGVDSSQLIFNDEFDLLCKEIRNNMKLVLVDHNKLSLKLAELDENVEMICDHHKDSHAHLHVQGESRIINFDEAVNKGVGSCCTLVTQQICELSPSLLDSEISTLLLGVILLDTGNLSPATGKTTVEDQEAVKELQAQTSNSELLYLELQNAKSSPEFWNSLSCNSCLRYDYKEFAVTAEADTMKYGMSSVLLPVSDLLKKDGGEVVKVMEKYCVDLSLDFLLVQAAFSRPVFQRELLLYKPERTSSDTFDRLSAFLSLASSTLNLEALPTSVGDGTNIFAYRQLNTQVSRKQLQPLVHDCVSTLVSKSKSSL
jgi:inorganic pyrophosphatase/exopolyphosphatase